MTTQTAPRRPKVSRISPLSVTLADCRAARFNKRILVHEHDSETLLGADRYVVPSNSGTDPYDVLDLGGDDVRCTCRSFVERQDCHHRITVLVMRHYLPLAALAGDYSPAALAQWHGEIAERLAWADRGYPVEPVVRTIGALRACEGALGALERTEAA